MCGFAAMIQPGHVFEQDLLTAMDRDLYHRGPDSGGQLSENGIAFVFRRLSILDPEPRSDQPMTSADGRYTLVFNGEIYNYKALREILIAKGAAFQTAGDTEVLLQGFIHFGEEILDRLEGMFAFAILDRKTGQLTVARDPFGIKPLYLVRKKGLVAVASEMRPLYRLQAPEADPTALSELLTFGWAAGKLSNVESIERVPGGTVLTVNLGDATVFERRYSDPLDTLKADNTMTPDSALEACRAALSNSVQDHLVSDVGYTLQLSGGVDSSVLTALAQDFTNQSIATFGISLGDFVYDESKYRRMVCERYPVQHTEFELDGQAFANALERATRHMEGPIPHGGCVGLMLLCDRIHETTKVTLVGEGADEMFGGYDRYANWRTIRNKEILSRLLPFPAHFLPARPPFLDIRQLAGKDAASYASVYYDYGALHSIFPNLVPSGGLRDELSRRFTDVNSRLFAIDQSCYLESLLMRQDKMSMAASVEARVPFVHMPLARVLNAIPRNIMAPGGETKPILKSIAERLLPHALIHRRKIGLRMPYRKWMRERNALAPFVDNLAAADSELGAFTERSRLRKVVEDFRAGRSSAERFPILRMVFVETWLRSLRQIRAELATGA
jgi:asparagine synthase (glutamine-hydrolysing)